MAQKGNKNAEKYPQLPKGWEDVVIGLYKKGASDMEAAYRINEDLCSFSYYLFLKMYANDEEFRAVIDYGRVCLSKHLRNGGAYLRSESRVGERTARRISVKGRSKTLSEPMRLHISSRAGVPHHLKTPNRRGDFKMLTRLGYSKRQLVKHFESLFQEGMNWRNYGAWEMDHVRPVSTFNLNEWDQVKECWKLENLQPLWHRENLRKRDLIIESNGSTERKQ